MPRKIAGQSALEGMIDTANDAPEAKALREILNAEAEKEISEALAGGGKEAMSKAALAVSARFANILAGFIVAKVGQLERRFEEQGRAYKGVWRDGRSYAAGSFVTHGGSMWHADKATTRKPGEGDWCLAVKRGADAK
jgi:hypothetical protein